MYRRIGVIALLAASLLVVLYIQPWKAQVQPPRFHDRLPEAEVIGKTDLLALSKAIAPSLYHYEIPIREFVSPDFILSQGKRFGLDVQSPVYFFGNTALKSVDEWGIMAMVKDSEKILEGIRQLDKVFTFKDTLLLEQKLYCIPELKMVVAYGNNWLLLSSEKNAANHLKYVISAKRYTISPRWRQFLNEKTYKEKPIVAEWESDQLSDYGFSSALVSATADSSSLMLHTHLFQPDSVSISIRPEGFRFQPGEYTKHYISASVNIDRLRNNKKDPVYIALDRLGKKVRFPLDVFLSAWNGDIAFRRGGIETIYETYIVSELDENFNISEVEKQKSVKISGFALYLSTSQNATQLLNTLFRKGILTEDQHKVRLLYSPPMHLKAKDTSLIFHTGKYAPTLTKDSLQTVQWTFDYVPYQFYLDQAKGKSYIGRIHIPLDKHVKRWLQR